MNLPILKRIPWHTEIDHVATGMELERRRRQKVMQLQTVAAKLGISKSYLSKLESGSGKWTQERVNQYLEAIK